MLLRVGWAMVVAVLTVAAVLGFAYGDSATVFGALGDAAAWLFG